MPSMQQPPTDLISALAHGLDPALFCRERLDFEPDPWQARLLRSTARQCVRYEHPTSSCPRVTKEWLEARRLDNPLRYNREYACEFGNPDDSLFSAEMIDRMLANDFEPLHL
jgi:hypothetical protein